jgi:hypothetical protein
VPAGLFTCRSQCADPLVSRQPAQPHDLQLIHPLDFDCFGFMVVDGIQSAFMRGVRLLTTCLQRYPDCQWRVAAFAFRHPNFDWLTHFYCPKGWGHRRGWPGPVASPRTIAAFSRHSSSAWSFSRCCCCLRVSSAAARNWVISSWLGWYGLGPSPTRSVNKLSIKEPISGRRSVGVRCGFQAAFSPPSWAVLFQRP